ncbi:hypothetical protein [Streptacidiphilus carbonis]|uniref:hypothetical protein n=1 Tax=Streptacidiphilus carbonis TaxID=105422 RepID=UPI0005A93ECD|nr:hypothetical protein [Streptacidiphilus carbonis]
MASMAKMKFHVAVTEEALTALNAYRRAEQVRETEWVTERRRELLVPGMPRRAAAAVRRNVRAEVARKRHTGEFAGTRDDIVARAVLEELRARSLDRKWPNPPAGALEGPGRPWGTPPSTPMGEGGYTHRVTVNLPHTLGDTVRRAVYWTSQAAVEALQEWADRWGDGADVALLEADRNGIPAELALLTAAGRPSAPQTALEIRDHLRAQILTTGDLIRASIERATGPGQPEIPGEA